MSRKTAVALLIAALVMLGVVALLVHELDRHVAPRALGDGRGANARGTAPTDRASAEAGAFLDDSLYLVRVVREDRGSAKGARVLVLGQGHEQEGQADALGVTYLRAAPPGSYVVAEVPGMPLVAAHVDPAEDGQVLLVPAGSVLAGRVTVSGGRLPEYLQLNTPEGPELDVIPPDWWDFLVRYRLFRRMVFARVADDGSFRFAGLRSGDGYELRLPWRRYVVWGSEDTSVLATVPNENLWLRVRALPVIAGRIVRPNGTPVANGTVRLCSDPVERADEDGRFSLPLINDPPLSVTVADERGRGSTTLQLRDPGPEGFSLGDVILRPLKGAVLVVLDELGKPLRGAVAQSLAPGAEVAGPADDGGRIEVASAGEPYYVAAWGHAVAEVDVPEGPGPLEVRLARTTMLRIRVLGDAPGAVVRLRAEAALLGSGSWKYRELLAAAGSTVPHGLARIRKGSDLRFEPGHAIALSGIVPDLTFQAELVDPLGLPYETHEITMRPAEEREVTLTAQRPYRTIKGVVRDDTGAPVVGALVRVAALGASRVVGSLSRRTDGSGQFAFPGVVASEVRLCVDADGLVPWSEDNMRLPPQGTDLEIRLSCGRSVRVVVVDEVGTPLMAYVTADLGSYIGWNSIMHRRVGVERPGGVYEIQGLPDADVDVTVKRPGDSRTVRVGARETEVRVIVAAR